MSSRSSTPNSQNHFTKTRRPPSRAKRPRSEENRSQGSSSDGDSSTENAPTRSSSRIRSRKLKKRKEENNSPLTSSNQESKKLTKNQLDGSQAVPKKVISTLPNTWCCTKISNASHTCEWTIENFSLLSLKKPGEAICSSQFKMPRLANLQCRFSIYPNGHIDDCKGTICFFIELSENDIEEIDYELKLYNANRRNVIETHRIRINKKKTSSGVCFIRKRSDMLALLGENDKLVTVCSISTSSKIIQTNSTDDEDLSHDFQNKVEILNGINELRNTKDLCNMTLCIENVEFCAHASILAARSSYFEKLLATFLQNKKFMKLSIDGVKSSVFKEVLHFLYTGQVLDMETYGIELLQAAYNFELPSLKAMCQMHFKKMLSVNNVLDVLVLADKVNASDLKQNVINYILAYSSDIVKSPKFAQLAKKLSPELTIQVLKELYD